MLNIIRTIKNKHYWGPVIPQKNKNIYYFEENKNYDKFIHFFQDLLDCSERNSGEILLPHSGYF